MTEIWMNILIALLILFAYISGLIEGLSKMSNANRNKIKHNSNKNE